VVQLSLTDHAFARIDSLLKRGDVRGAIGQYHNARRWKFFGYSPDLWYSQPMAWVTQVVAAGQLRDLARAETLESSRISFEHPGEDQIAAAYHRAILCASIGRQNEAELIARQMSAEAPNWYQPHWILSRLLAVSGRLEEAKQEELRPSPTSPILGKSTWLVVGIP
jgi:hypothetical protein